MHRKLSILTSWSSARSCIPLLVILSAAGCAGLPVAQHVEAREVTVQVPAKTAFVFSRTDAIVAAQQYAASLHLPSNLEAQIPGIIEKHFGQSPETARVEIAASTENRKQFCANLESTLNQLLVPNTLYTHENRWTHKNIEAKTSGGNKITLCQGDRPFPSSAILTSRFAKEWDWRNTHSRGCPTCYADSFIELSLPMRINTVRNSASGDERIRIAFRLDNFKSKDPTVMFGKAVADTHFAMDGFLAALSRLPDAYPRKYSEPVNPYAKTVSQAKYDIDALAETWRKKIAREQQAALEKVASDRKASKEAALTRWRATVKAGDEGWVGPVSFAQYFGREVMMHALVIERRGELIHVQYDGKTDYVTVSLREKGAWVKIRAFYPESEFMAGGDSSIHEPNTPPVVRY